MTRTLSVVEDGDGTSRGAVDRRRNRNVDCPHQRARVRHVAVQRHDVQVIGVSGENVVDQVRRSGKGSFRVDGRLPTERRITSGSDVRRGRSIDADGRERTTALADAHPPGIQEHAREITGVVDMEVTEEDGLQPCEVETGLDECGWAPLVRSRPRRRARRRRGPRRFPPGRPPASVPRPFQGGPTQSSWGPHCPLIWVRTANEGLTGPVSFRQSLRILRLGRILLGVGLMRHSPGEKLAEPHDVPPGTADFFRWSAPPSSFGFETCSDRSPVEREGRRGERCLPSPSITDGARPQQEDEPDVRFTYANERTFLAWNRTALALIATGVAATQLLPKLQLEWGRRLLGLPLIALGALVAAESLRQWRANQRAMRRGDPLPRSWMPLVLTIGIVVIGAIAVAIAAFGTR